MPDPGLNQVCLDAVLAEIQPLRRSPAGVPVLNCMLAHESEQIEAGRPRDVSLELQAVVVGDAAGMLAAAAPGMKVRVAGFLAARSLRSRAPVLHLNKIEFLEGN